MRIAHIVVRPRGRSTGSHRARLGFVILLPALLVLLVAPLHAQNDNRPAGVKGVVRDSHGQLIRDLTVYLENTMGNYVHDPMIGHLHLPTGDSGLLSTRTDSQGAYSFTSVPEGAYRLYVDSAKTGHAEAGPFTLRSEELKIVDLALTPTALSNSMPSFYDEPQFTVAGVTQTGNAGGHGSETIRRNSEALTKAAVSLSDPSQDASTSKSTVNLEHTRAELQARLAQKDTAELHHLLADVEERLANPLEAVREYQRAAEMEPSEPYVFDWGAELLAHRAPEPAAEVFTRGHRLFPRSARMLVGLAVAQYTRALYDKAAQALFEASDLNPADSTPYLFLGRMQGVETTELHGLSEKFARFAALQPDNALANYYYAVSLRRDLETLEIKNGAGEEGRTGQIKELLDKAIHLDPKLGPAYLQLGLIASEKDDLQQAITDYEKAVATDPNLVEAHYRLGQAYRRTGRKEEAQRELQIYQELSKQSDAQAERDRREVQQFVITMRDRAAPPSP
jgi:tetratricopeptide (TPR) repeat protein